MKRILFFCAAMLAVLACNAQSVQVLKDGKLIAEFYERDGWEFVFKEKEEDPADPYNGHEYVDLGLPSGLKWATMNVGATKPEEYGDYFAWGETEPKSTYNWSTYFDSVNGSNYVFTKYALDKKTQLDPEDDAAHVNWGGDWRMPTDAELTELRTECSWKWTTSGGVNGYVVKGPNGNSIFLPAAGYRLDSSPNHAGSYGHYWSSSLIDYGSNYVWGVDLSSNTVYRDTSSRCYGQSVRPVCP